MRLQEYGVWLDVMHNTNSNKEYYGMVDPYTSYVIPYSIMAVEELVATNKELFIDIAVIAYGVELDHSWVIDNNSPSSRLFTINSIMNFIQLNTIDRLKKKYKNEARRL